MRAQIETDTHIYFYGGPFSQWAECRFNAKVPDGESWEFNTAEKYMMLCKAAFFEDKESYEAIIRSDNPAAAKAMGRKVKGFDIDKWNEVARDVVFTGNLAKFTSTPTWKRIILETGNRILVEGSPTDRMWGVGLAYDDPRILDEKNWRGTNWLGEVLMEVRESILQSEPTACFHYP